MRIRGNSPSPSGFLHLLLSVVIGLSFVSTDLPAQDAGGVDDPEVMYLTAVQRMREGKWAPAKAILNKLLIDYAMDSPHPTFGSVPYQLGVCEYNLKNYGEAAKMFQMCHEKFKPQGGAEGGVNINWKPAVFQWAGCEQMQKNWDAAIQRYKQYYELIKPDLKEIHPSRLLMPQLWFNLGICYINSGRLAEGQKYFQALFENPERFGATEQILLSAFLNLAKVWVQEQDEKAANSFLDQFGPMLQTSPGRKQPVANQMIQLGVEADKQGLPILALRLFSLVPQSKDIYRDLEAIVTNLGDGASAQLKKMRDAAKAKLTAADPPEVLVLGTIGKIYGEMRNPYAAYVTNAYVAANYPKSKHHPLFLYQATFWASRFGDWNLATVHGLEFIEKYPKHELRPRVDELLLGTLFANGQYEKALKIALDIRTSMAPGSPQRDLPDFIVGGCYFYLANFESAQPELDNHVSKYPESKFAEQSRYYQAVNLVKLLRWKPGGEKLDAFMKEFPESAFMDGALYYRAYAHFAVNEFPEAIHNLDMLKAKFPETPMRDQALNVRGDIVMTVGADGKSEGNLPLAEEIFLKVRPISDQMGKDAVAAYSIYRLVDVTAQLGQEDGKETKLDDTVKHRDTFAGTYAPSYHDIDVAVISLPAMARAKRTEEAIDHLRKLIVKEGKNPNSEGLSKGLKAYVDFYKETYGIDKLIAHLKNFPDADFTDASMRAWLLMARIEAMEEEDPQKFKAPIQLAYGEMLKDYEKKDMANYILVSMGRHLSNVAGNPVRARGYFDFIVNERKDVLDYQDHAALELGLLLANSKVAAERIKGMKLLERVRDEFQTEELKEDAQRGIATILYAQKDYKAMREAWGVYLENRGWSRYAPEAKFRIAETFDKEGDQKKAMTNYARVFIEHAGKVEWSTKAYVRTAEILQSMGEDQKAYEILSLFIGRMGHMSEDPRIPIDSKNNIQEGRNMLGRLKIKLDIQDDPKK